MSHRAALFKRLKAVTQLSPREALDELRSLAQEPEIRTRWRAFGQKVNQLDLGLPSVKLLGSCTLDYLAPQLAADLLFKNQPFKVSVGGYDQVLQDLEQQEEPYAILVPWRKQVKDLESELMFWQTCWGVAEKKKIRFIQVSFDWIRPDSSGHHCQQIREIGKLNDKLRERLPSGNFFLDLGLISGVVGRKHFYDSRSYYWTKQPFSDQGLQALSAALVAGLRTLVTGPKKVLVLDLDNTLWGGEVGERGLHGIGLEGAEGEAFLAFQRHVKQLQQQGVLLAIASKNEEAVALDALANNPHLVLRPDDFVATEIHWKPKSQSLQNIAQKLRLSLDSFVFFDDNPRERAEVARALPEVEVVEISGDPVDYIDDLQAGMFFETMEITTLDRSRTEQYQQEAERSKARETVGDYFTYLEMKAKVSSISEENLSRTVQLLARTNQFNLTTKRHGPEEIKSFSEQDYHYLKCLELVDRFGNLGIISVLLAISDDPRTVRIDSWVMSCRALQRTVEMYFFNQLVLDAGQAGFERIVGEFRPTAKNKPVEGLYRQLGFQDLGEGQFELQIKDYTPLPTYVC